MVGGSRLPYVSLGVDACVNIYGNLCMLDGDTNTCDLYGLLKLDINFMATSPIK